ncbi:unnamed protein product [Rotaria sp. Silwood2]|nr:unnamed protein product [Rotaria sp. Silwood2]CAF3163718.1 unnamed protein product [Rotaria sp. Silwood2]CAF3368465.1 unnamed protein product [Rotaria sp. Silwood2]CAF4097058.1 unnamed protein product [Rotaria sp. Silwood2]CAF4251996.1 unnamed protein product [Rotaria sp. Silwood2]
MSSTPQQSQPTQQPALMNTGQAYIPTSHTTNDQYTLAQNGSYSNDQVLVQYWYSNNAQPIEQTRQMAANQFVAPLCGQQFFLSSTATVTTTICCFKSRNATMYATINGTTSHVPTTSTNAFSLHSIK